MSLSALDDYQCKLNQIHNELLQSIGIRKEPFIAIIHGPSLDKCVRLAKLITEALKIAQCVNHVICSADLNAQIPEPWRGECENQQTMNITTDCHLNQYVGKYNIVLDSTYRTVNESTVNQADYIFILPSIMKDTVNTVHERYLYMRHGNVLDTKELFSQAMDKHDNPYIVIGYRSITTHSM